MESDKGAGRDQLTGAVHLAVLCAFAVAQPLFDLLGSGPEFFAVRASQPVDLWVLAIVLCLIVPLPLIAIYAAAVALGKVAHGKKVGRIVCSALSCMLLTAVALPPFERTFSLGPWPTLGFALLIGLTGAVVLDRWSLPKQLLTVLALVLLLFPAIFLFRPGMAKLVFPQRVELTAATDATAPIVLLIFDELPLTSLLADQETIDKALYPNFSRLADEATWYPNAAAASDYTVLAVPAILSGEQPTRGRLPLASAHPNNLFTLLGDAYSMNVAESVTQVCPARLCDDSRRDASFVARMRSLLADTRLLYLHVLLPKAWAQRLPSVTQNWMLFDRESDWLADWRRRASSDSNAHFDDFLSGIVPSTEPSLHLLHLLLPHPPFVHLPNGQVYSFDGNVVGLSGDEMADDEWAAIQIQQRHLLQLGYVDHLLGEVRSRLEEVGLWERAVVVVTSDHGASFAKSENRRQLKGTNYSAIVPIPLIIKAPDQQEGRQDSRLVSSMDILPTIAELAGAHVPWATEGVALTRSKEQIREHVPVTRHARRRRRAQPALYSAADLEAGRAAALATLEERFGPAGATGRNLFHVGPHREWIGHELAEFPIGEPTDYHYQLKLPSAALNVDPSSWFVPAHIHGELLDADIPESVDLAVVVNGTVAAVTRTWSFEPSQWSAIVDPEVFVPGDNRVELMALAASNSADPIPTLRPVPNATSSLANLPIHGLLERGLYGLEEWPDTYVRWTNGDAEITFQVDAAEPPTQLRLKLAGNAPGGSQLRIAANGKDLFAGRIGPIDGDWSSTFDLTDVDIDDRLTFQIESNSFVPTDFDDNSVDSRRLGVAIADFELIAPP